MSARIDLPLPAHYTIEESGWATAGAHSFAAAGAARGAPAVVLSVTPDRGSAWEGEFFGDRDQLCLISSTPNPHTVLVVAGGVGYLVETRDPTDYVVLPIRPIVDVVVSPQTPAVLCVGLTDIASLGDMQAIAWTTPRLVADGFSDVRVASDFLVARGRSATSDEEVEVVLDLATGRPIGRPSG